MYVTVVMEEVLHVCHFVMEEVLHVCHCCDGGGATCMSLL